MPQRSKKLNVNIISSYPPRECGIATYTKNLFQALNGIKPKINVSITALENGKRNKRLYPKEVSYILEEGKRNYMKAAEHLNKSAIDIVLLQHEYGLYSGFIGSDIIELYKKLNKPVITYCHTVPYAKGANCRISRMKLLKKICGLSDLAIVPAEIILKELIKKYDFPKDKLQVIRHGTPKVKFVSQKYAKKKLGIRDKKIISTIGLINLKKGIDLIIKALPQILKKHHDISYYIVGEPHPSPLRKKRIEKYLRAAMKEAKKLGVYKNIKRVDRYLPEDELIRYFQASDIFLTPHLALEQAVSGTLAYAVACGRCVISTPYIYAKEMIGDNKRGLLVKPKNVNDIAKKVNYILDHPKIQHQFEKKAHAFGKKTAWNLTAQKHYRIFKRLAKK